MPITHVNRIAPTTQVMQKRGTMTARYGVVIIGSGAGGGTVLEYLSRFIDRGLKVLLLERGPYWPKESFMQREIEMSKIYFNRGAVLSADRSARAASVDG